jgi:hypothetical protein
VILPLQTAWLRPEIGDLALIATFGIMLVVIPLGMLIEPSSFLGNWLDVVVWVYLAGEVALFTILLRMSTGSWSNYAIQAVVFASVLTARAVSRTADALSPSRVLRPVALGVLGVLASATNALFETTMKTRADRGAVAAIVAHVQRPSSAFFFASRPGLNRVHGRQDLVYDDWLYPVFEQLGLAQPRSQWLGPALAAGPVHVVVNPSKSRTIEGVEPTLYALGYRHEIQVGPSFYVWTR